MKLMFGTWSISEIFPGSFQIGGEKATKIF